MYFLDIFFRQFAHCLRDADYIGAALEVQAIPGALAAHLQSLLRITSQGLLTGPNLSNLHGPNQLLHATYLYLKT